MINAIIGTKIDQSQFFTAEGKLIPVTRIKTGPLFVVAVKTKEKDGYDAIQIGLGNRRTTTVKRPNLGHLKKAGLDKNPPRFLKEIPQLSKSEDEAVQIKPGIILKVQDILKEGDKVLVTGISKGKGFQGVVKRYGFRGGPRTHGQSDRERAPGSIGQTTTPGRVYKGKRMAGHMGVRTTTVKNLQVIGFDSEKEILTLSGLVPGGRNSLLTIKKIN